MPMLDAYFRRKWKEHAPQRVLSAMNKKLNRIPFNLTQFPIYGAAIDIGRTIGSVSLNALLNGLPPFNPSAFVPTSMDFMLLVYSAAAITPLVLMDSYSSTKEPLEDILEFDRVEVTKENLLQQIEDTTKILQTPRQEYQFRDYRTEVAANIAKVVKRVEGIDVTPAIPKRTLLTLHGGVTFLSDAGVGWKVANATHGPFVTAHESAHTVGYAREDEASLVGWMACQQGFARSAALEEFTTELDLLGRYKVDITQYIAAIKDEKDRKYITPLFKKRVGDLLLKPYDYLLEMRGQPLGLRTYTQGFLELLYGARDAGIIES